MYKVYISRVPDMELDGKVRKVLRENGFQCEDWQWRNVASDADIHKALKESDGANREALFKEAYRILKPREDWTVENLQPEQRERSEAEKAKGIS